MERKLGESEYKQKILEVLIKADRICREKGIGYMIACGTLLGAVRHGGFIPWDDDIDIMIRREDYPALKKAIDESDCGLHFLGVEDPENTNYPFAKICAEDTVLVERNFLPVEGLGAYVDVFLLDWLPSEEAARLRFHKRLVPLRKLAQHSSRVGYDKSGGAKTRLLRALAFRLTRPLDPRKLNRRLNRLCQSYKGPDRDWSGIAWSRRECYPRAAVEPFRPIVFEGHEFMGPADPDAVLRISYGDYMQLPPPEQRVKTHNFDCWYWEVRT